MQYLCRAIGTVRAVMIDMIVARFLQTPMLHIHSKGTPIYCISTVGAPRKWEFVRYLYNSSSARNNFPTLPTGY